MIRAGISTACYYPTLTEDSLKLAAEAGAGVCEVFVNAECEFKKEFGRRLLSMSGGLGLEIVSVHPFTSGYETMMFFSNYQRRFEDSIEQYKRYFEYSALLGAKFFVLHGVHKGAPIENGAVYERFAIMQRAAKNEGITLLHENVSRCKSGEPEFIRDMIKAIPEEAAFVLDTKQAVRAGHSVNELQAAMDGKIYHVHLSDNSPGEDCLLPGNGRFNIKGFVNSLVSEGYVGDILLEVYCNNYQHIADLTSSYKFLLSCM